MDKTIIEVKNVSVKYITGDLRNIGLKEYLMKKLTRQYEIKSFMAVNDVSFTVEQGDMLGIVGNNGAGKSTLLKVVTKIMQPSKGAVKVNGRIAALLELASGFDGDLNLKENAYLRGAMLGYTRLDEVLSVGDGAFREKSESKMREIIQNGKATILVSHSIPQIRRMCNKVLWLDHGNQIRFGEAASVCDEYDAFLKTGILPEKENK